MLDSPRRGSSTAASLLPPKVPARPKGTLDTARLHRKFGIDPLAEWSETWRKLEAEGMLEGVARRLVLSRRGLLMVDALLHRFFEENPVSAAETGAAPPSARPV